MLDTTTNKTKKNMNQGYVEEKTPLHKEGMMTLWICQNTPLQVWLLNACQFWRPGLVASFDDYTNNLVAESGGQ